MPGSVPVIPGVKLEAAEQVHFFREEVAKLLGRRNLNFPGAQPVSFSRHHLRELETKDYFLCEKTDGIRCLLYCTTGDSVDEELHYLIDRKNEYYFVQGLHLPHHQDQSFTKFHANTILDGELVLDQLEDGERLRFLVFDCLVLDNENLLQKTFDKRIGRLQEFVFKPLKKMGQLFGERMAREFPFEVMFKHMEKPYAFHDMFTIKLPNLPHGNDGLIFTCKETPYVTGTDEHILKWKPAHENSVDFRLHLGEFPKVTDERGEVYEDYDAMPVFNIEVYHGGNDYRDWDEPLYLEPEDWEAMKSRAMQEGRQLDGRIIECYKDEQGRWRPKREEDGSPRYRDDKEHANHISTVNKVIESIRDGVSQEDLINAAPSIARAWKARHPEEEEAKRRMQAQQQQQRPSLHHTPSANGHP